MAMQLDQLLLNASERSAELEHLNQILEQQATTDGLTGLYNHRYFYQRLQDEIRRSRRYGHPLSLIIADIDFFKKYNDQNGHVAGDTLLKSFAMILRESARDNDVVARYGGEEFAVILVETNREQALSWAERIRERIENSAFTNATKLPGKRLTVSMGVIELRDDFLSASELVQAADQLLYQAKHNGRNRVEG